MNTSTPWNRHYQTARSRQQYPDENLVRLLVGLEREGHSLRDSSVLDYGFGSGRHLQLLQNLQCQKISGCEISDVAFHDATTEFADIELRLIQSVSDLTELWSAGTFDVIVCWGVLHYLPPDDRNDLLIQFQRLLKPSGRLLGTLRSSRDNHFSHSEVADAGIHYFTEDQLRDLLSSTFSDLRLGHMERTPVGKLEQTIAHWFFSAGMSG